MVPKPRQNKPQSQPITTALANILRDYPAGGTVLRELLQNADDAGAAKIDFHLCTPSAPPPGTPHPLLHPALLEYQGPAILAHNGHPPFSADDFDSLSHVGDSGKRYDDTKTGKFGLGFNSVYNWTDAPSILSGRNLLLLDPHHSWSASLGPPGGPFYDFVDDAGDIEMANQLKPFSYALAGHDFGTPLDGTVIRLPLRTNEQAQRSRICQVSTAVGEVREVLNAFAEGFIDGYGVFLRSIEEVGFWEDGKKVGSCKVVNQEEVRKARAKIDEAYRDVFVDRSKDGFTLTFEMDIQVNLHDDRDSRKTWVVHHAMQRDVGPELTGWGRERKLFGWVGVAVPFQGAPVGNLNGGLYTVLPLDKPSGHPAHLHGMFSITSDRASIHSRAEKSLQDHRPFLWNEKLFRSLIPAAWASLLDHLRRRRPEEGDLMDYWPRPGSTVGQLGENMCRDLVEFVTASSLQVFFTGKGFVSIEGGLFVKDGEVGEELRLALGEVGVPVVYIQQRHLWVHDLVLALSPNRLLCPETLCDFLHTINSLESASVGSKNSLLEYILSNTDIDAGLKLLYSLPLFRMGDGTYQALEEGLRPIFLSVDQTEERLFRLQPERNIDLQLLSTTAVGILRKIADVGTTPIRRYSVASLVEYCQQKFFIEYSIRHGQGVGPDLVPFSPTLRELIDDIWDWVMTNAVVPTVPQSILMLWLIPLHGGRYLRRSNTISLVPTLHSLTGTTGQLLARLADGCAKATVLPLLDTESLSPQSQGFLVERGETRYGMMLGDCGNLRSLLPWLVAGKEAVQAATDDDKRLLLTTIANKFVVEGTGAIADHLKQLPLFEQVISPFVDGDRERHQTWVDNRQDQILVGIGDLPFAPDIGGIAFICSDNQNVRDMLRVTGIASWPPTAALLEDYLIPSLTPENCSILSDALKIQTLELILCNHLNLSPKCRALVSKLPIVPIEMTASATTEEQTFHSMSELLDPGALDIKGIFFSDELLYPHMGLLERFEGVMQQYGLKSRLTWKLVLERIRLYAATGRPLEEVESCVRMLLQLSIDNTGSSASELQEVKDLEWVVAKSVQTQEWVRMKPLNCLGPQYFLVAGRVASVLEYKMHSNWQRLLGCGGRIHTWVLEKQLQIGIDEMDMDIVNAVLAYIGKQRLPEHVDALRPMACVLGTSGKTFLHSKVFRTDAKGLRPYLDVVEDRFWKKHQPLLEELGVARCPSLDDLLRVQEQLAATEQPLGEADTDVAVAVVEFASKHRRDLLPDLKIPDRGGYLQEIENITSWDMEYSCEKQTTPLVHPKITMEAVENLAIQKFSDKILMGQLGVDDRDDDEYFQHEETTTRIADTLCRYSVTSTFSEYLANAEDSGATSIDWLLDECRQGEYPAARLLTKDLRSFQGQSLFVHNDSVFQDEDFEGFKQVGKGSKREEEWAIGQFGRGAQTMYHWTDVPMLISGKYFLILDPQEKFLPLNRKHGRRKPGVKIELSKLRESCSDQLAPFDGLWGYSKGLDDYEGTIFRFPLRAPGSETGLTESKMNLGYLAARTRLEEYFPKARVSLLFLQNIETITFGVRHGEGPAFRVQRPSRPPIYQQFESVFIRHAKLDILGKEIEGEDSWRIARQDISTTPQALDEWQSKIRRRQKYPNCGIAALLSPPTTLDFKPSMFSTLPLPFESHLPVHINASFALSGDRRSILVEETSWFDGSTWNKWLLQENIPDLYLRFLEDLVRMPGINAYKFWPTREPSRDGLSDIIREAFWRGIPSSRYRLYPGARSMTEGRVIKTGRGRGGRQVIGPGISWEFKDAVFDFVFADSSPRLQDLVRTWFPNLVRVNSESLSKDLRLTLGIKEIAPSLVRKRLQAADACNELETCFKAEPDVLDVILLTIWPRRDEDREELDGCRILPLLDGSLGFLRLAQPGGKTYFFATEEEQALFGFASSIFVKNGVGEIRAGFALESPYYRDKFLRWLVKCSKFNVRNLAVQDLKQVLSCRSLADRAPTPALESWLIKFWRYFNKRYQPEPSETGAKTVSECGIEDFQIYQAKKGSSTTYISPTMFVNLPSVIRAQEGKPETLLCDQFPDLYVVNPALVPNSLAREVFFSRFVRAVSGIATAKGIGLMQFLSSTLDQSSTKTLLILTSEYMRRPTLESDHDEAYKRDVLYKIGLLPIWPSVAGPTSHVAAANALAARNAALLVPWLTRRAQFIEPSIFQTYEEVLERLGVKALGTANIFHEHIVPSLPRFISPEQMIDYRAMLDVMKENSGVIVQHRHSKLAVDGGGIMRRADELYDHRDEVYSSAFGLQDPDRFLHNTLRKYHSIWVKMGLRGGGNSRITGEEYLACIRSVAARIPSLPVSGPSSGMRTSYAVLQGLSRLSPSIDPTARLFIKSVKAVYSRTLAGDREPVFRRTKFRDFVERQRLLSLSEVVHWEHAPYCWTQAQFSLDHLPVQGFDTLGISGAPSIPMVWDHLRALVKVAETLVVSDVKPFLEDLSRTYRYLQEHASDGFPFRSSEKIWLNIDSTGSSRPTVLDIVVSWMDIKHLILFCPYDPGDMQYVRSFLTPYQELLKKCGCQPIRTPTRKEIERPASGSMPSEISRLWKDSKLTDITFEAEGRLVHAHKLVLAAASKKYEKLFTGHWAGSPDARGSEPIKLISISHHTLLLMLDFAYHDHIDFQPLQAQEGDDTDRIANKLDVLLDLLAGADEWLMSRLCTEVECRILECPNFVRPDNVRYLIEIADKTNSNELRAFCLEYCIVNSETMEVVDSADKLEEAVEVSTK